MPMAQKKGGEQAVMPYTYPSDYTPSENHWTDDRDEVLAFGHVLIQMGVFRNADDAWAYFEKPWKWDQMYNMWVRHGKPDEGRAFDKFFKEALDNFGF